MEIIRKCSSKIECGDMISYQGFIAVVESVKRYERPELPVFGIYTSFVSGDKFNHNYLRGYLQGNDNRLWSVIINENS